MFPSSFAHCIKCSLRHHLRGVGGGCRQGPPQPCSGGLSALYSPSPMPFRFHLQSQLHAPARRPRAHFGCTCPVTHLPTASSACFTWYCLPQPQLLACLPATFWGSHYPPIMSPAPQEGPECPDLGAALLCQWGSPSDLGQGCSRAVSIHPLSAPSSPALLGVCVCSEGKAVSVLLTVVAPGQSTQWVLAEHLSASMAD